MTTTAKLPALPMRTINVGIPDNLLDALDTIGVATNTPRAALVREAIGVWVSMHDDPLGMISGILDGMEAMQGEDETDQDRIGEPKVFGC